MPIIDKDIGTDKREFKISKEGLDPFGARKQAMSMVREELYAPVGPNMAGLDYGIEDRGDYYEVTVEKKERRAGPKGIAKARGMIGSGAQDKGKGRDKGRGTQKALNRLEEQTHNVDRPAQRSSGKGGQGEGGSFDLQSRLDSLYTVPELRDEARRAGVYVSQNAKKRDIIEALANGAPFRARQMTGRQ